MYSTLSILSLLILLSIVCEAFIIIYIFIILIFFNHAFTYKINYSIRLEKIEKCLIFFFNFFFCRLVTTRMNPYLKRFQQPDKTITRLPAFRAISRG